MNTLMHIKKNIQIWNKIQDAFIDAVPTTDLTVDTPALNRLVSICAEHGGINAVQDINSILHHLDRSSATVETLLARLMDEQLKDVNTAVLAYLESSDVFVKCCSTAATREKVGMIETAGKVPDEIVKQLTAVGELIGAFGSFDDVKRVAADGSDLQREVVDAVGSYANTDAPAFLSGYLYTAAKIAEMFFPEEDIAKVLHGMRKPESECQCAGDCAGGCDDCKK